MAAPLLRFSLLHRLKRLQRDPVMVLVRAHLVQILPHLGRVVLAQVLEDHGAVDLLEDPDPGRQDMPTIPAAKLFG
jgi:hypothetical protein